MERMGKGMQLSPEKIDSLRRQVLIVALRSSHSHNPLGTAATAEYWLSPQRAKYPQRLPPIHAHPRREPAHSNRSFHSRGAFACSCLFYHPSPHSYPHSQRSFFIGKEERQEEEQGEDAFANRSQRIPTKEQLILSDKGKTDQSSDAFAAADR